MQLPSATRQVTRMLKELAPHTDSVTAAAWSPSAEFLASIGRDKRLLIHKVSSQSTVRQHQFPYPLMHAEFLNDNTLILCDFTSTLRSYSFNDGKTLDSLHANVERAYAMAMSHVLSTIALGYRTGLVQFIEYRDAKGTLATDVVSVAGPVWQVDWSTSGDFLYVSSIRDGVSIFDYKTKYLLDKYPGDGPFAVSERAQLIASHQRDFSIRIYSLRNKKRVASLEGSATKIGRICFTEDGAYLLAKSVDGKFFIWSTANWKLLSLINETAIYPRFPLSASPADASLYVSTGSMQKALVLRGINEPELPEFSSAPNPHYKNAKVVIMGEQGVGKSALAHQLLGKGWRLTESTHGRQITRLAREHNGTEYRELYLWDLAGQPNYHLIHQLHLDETCVSLILFDDQAERDPFARPRYWDRALSTAAVHSSLDSSAVAKFLVAGRVDRGDPHVSPESIQRFHHRA